MKHTFKWVLALATVFAFQSQAQETQEAEVIQEAEPVQEEVKRDIWTAASTGDVELIKTLLDEGVKVDEYDATIGSTALSYAAIFNQAEAAKLLIDSGANVNDGGMSGNTPLHAASFVGNAEIASLLIEAGANAAQANYEGQTAGANLALDWPTTQYIAAMLQIPLEEEAVMSGRAKIGEMFQRLRMAAAENDIWVAVQLNQPKFVEKLIAGGADVNEAAEDGSSLLATAIGGNANEIIKMLIDAGADVNSINVTNGITPLHAAAFFGRSESAKLLVDAGANTAATDYNGATVQDLLYLDWPTTEYIASLIGLTLVEEEVMSGRKQIGEMLAPEAEAEPAAEAEPSAEAEAE